jgi:hypothetical protein
VTAGESSAVAAAVADAHRREWAFVLAATVRVTSHPDVAHPSSGPDPALGLGRHTAR